MKISSTKKAAIVTIFFILVGLAFAIHKIDDWRTSLPLLIFYAILSANTFFSIRCFASITPERRKDQWTLDIFLVISYIFLAMNFNNPYNFTFFAAVLFAVAAIKYILLLFITGYDKLVKRKIFIDSLGTLSCILAFGGVLSGHPFLASWIWVIVFLAANYYIFFIDPLYKLPE